MKGGGIEVEGDVKGVVGEGMSGGEIHVNGNFKGASRKMKGGKVYHKGKLIEDK
jgi:formylmethanofuran dehydrogenase subunit C